MKELTIIFVAICFMNTSHGQTDFRQGYLITLAGDTVPGLVDYREGSAPFQSFDFKKSENDKPLSYQPGEASGYGFTNGRCFQSRQIEEDDHTARTVFLEVIVEGYVSLYKLQDVYFIEKQDKGFFKLVNGSREIIADGKKYMADTHEYAGVLNLLLFDCHSLRARIQYTELKEKTLTRLVEDYNECKGLASITHKASKPWIKLKTGLTAGIAISSIEFHPIDPGFKHLNTSFSNHRSLIAGINSDISFPRLTERFSVNAGIMYMKSEHQGFNTVEDVPYIKRNSSTIRLESLKIPVALCYTFPERRVTPYVNAGISSTYHIDYESSLVEEVESNTGIRTYYREAVPIQRNEMGLWGGLGGTIKLHPKSAGFLEIRFEKMSGFSNQPVITVISNFQVIVGIRTR